MMRCVRLFFVLLTLALVVGCSKGESPENEVFAVSDLAHKKVGVIKGTTAEAYAMELGNGSMDMKFESYPSLKDMVEPLLQGELDAILSDDVPAKVLVDSDPSLRILDEALKEESYAGVIAKEKWGLLDSVNVALIQMRATGVYDSIVKSYVGGDAKYRVPLGPANGPVLKVATYAKFPPFVYYNEKKELVGSDVEIVRYAALPYLSGLSDDENALAVHRSIVGNDADVEIVRYVADYLERPLEIIDMDFGKIIDAVRDGQADLGFAAFSVTEERKQLIDFTDNYATSRIVVVVRSGKTKSFFQGIKDSLFGK